MNEWLRHNRLPHHNRSLSQQRKRFRRKPMLQMREQQREFDAQMQEQKREAALRFLMGQQTQKVNMNMNVRVTDCTKYPALCVH